MKNTIKVLAIIALAAVIGFSFAACDNGGGGGDDGPSPYLGETVTISDDQVYMYDEDTSKFTAFNGNLKLKEENGVSGEIKGGKLTLTLVAPTSGSTVLDGFLKFLSMSLHYKTANELSFEGLGITSLGVYIDEIEIVDSDDWAFMTKDNSLDTNDEPDEWMIYMYVAEDVKITTEKGITETDEDGETDKYDKLNLSLKKGWNAVCYKYSWKGTTTTHSMYMGNPKNLKWLLYYNDEEDD